jgi:hypothetical protein
MKVQLVGSPKGWGTSESTCWTSELAQQCLLGLALLLEHLTSVLFPFLIGVPQTTVQAAAATL